MGATLARAQAGAALRSPPGQVLRRKCACEGSGHECEDCQQKLKLRRRPADGGGPELAPPIVHRVLQSPGEPLDLPTRAFMESRFGHDFGRVRVHRDALAAESAGAVNARAYTVGRDVVFAEGPSVSRTPAERRLLAHELAHVVQHAGAGVATPSSLAVGRPDDGAEREADAAAEQAITRGARLRPSSWLVGAPILRRQVRNKVITAFQKSARACVVHVHGEERTALAVGKEIRSRRCVNLMHLDTTKRHVDFDFTESGIAFEGQADPNRILTPAGRSGPEAILETHAKVDKKGAAKLDPKKVRAAAEKVLADFANQMVIPTLDQCRKDEQNPEASLPVMALHNNENLLPSTAIASTKRTPNPAAGDPGSPSDFFLVTKEADFDVLKGSHNVVLQENPVQAKNDDGSMSVLLANSRYVNVEKEGRRHDRPLGKDTEVQRQDEFYVKNYAMASTVLDQFGLSRLPCGGSADFEKRSRSIFNRRRGQSGRQTTALPSDQPVFAREALPDPPPKGCLLFKDQPAIDKRADDWRKKLEAMPLLNVVHWVVGAGKFKPDEAVKEFQQQQTCMITAMRDSLKTRGLALPKGSLVQSEERTAAQQAGIWSRKFGFTNPEPFDRISDFARKKCAPALGADVRWDPKNKDHKTCWNQLTNDEKQKEILMASSAPGVSRHHLGVDFDVGETSADLDPKEWTGTGRFADAFRWMARNASTFGFIQPFETKGGYGVGYMPERWHWSYYPVAQAALEFIMDHDAEVEAALQKLWSDGKGGIKPEFSFIAKDWRKYVFNVEQLGVF